MLSPRMRPRFEMRVPHTTEETLSRLESCLGSPDGGCTGEVAGNHFHLNVNRHLQKIWSPHLNLEVQEDEAGSVIHGHFGPRSDIWTMVMAIYAICAFVIAMGTLFAISQWILGMSAWAIWPVIGAIVIAAVVYFLALSGQVLSQTQMKMLLNFVERAAGVKETEV